MKRIAYYILCFITGFYGTALIVDQDNPELLFIKSMFTCCMVTIALILLLINNIKIKKKNE